MDISPLIAPLAYLVVFLGTIAGVIPVCLLPIATSVTGIGFFRRSKKPKIIGAWLMGVSVVVGVLSYPFVVDFYSLFLL